MKTIHMNLTATMLLIILVFMACSNATKKNPSSSNALDQMVLNKQNIAPEIEKILYQFPTPLEVTTMLEKAKAAFIFDLSNPVGNLDKYMTEKAKALFLGVYSADLSYAAAYNRTDEIKKIMECTSKLSNDLGISGIYNENLVETVKNNYDSKDSLVHIFTRVFDETKSFLSTNNRDHVSILIVTGGFIETLYIASNLNILAEDKREISKIILNQHENLTMLLQILEVFSSDETINTIAARLVDLKNFYEKNPYNMDMGFSEERAVEINNLIEKSRESLGN